LIATTARNSSNIYVLSEIGNEKCCIGKEAEGWLCHRRMGHIKFDNLVKVIRKEAFSEIPQITKSTNTYANIVNKERKQRPGSNQRNNQQQDHWKLCIMI
jgi:hypothetical protein